MASTFAPSLTGNIPATEKQSSLLTNFFKWCTAQEPNRLLWLGIALAGHGAVITPLTLLVVVMAGTSLTLFMAAMVAMGMTLVSNLAALPTRYTIPVFALSVVVDLVIVCIAVYQGLHLSNMGL